MKRLGAVSAAMLDHAERRQLERERQGQIAIENQWNGRRKISKLCKVGRRHRQCFALNCPCQCHMEKA